MAIKNETIIGVSDVEKSSNWYQKLLNCNSSHGGKTFEMLTDENNEVFLCLHKWGEHEHPTLASAEVKPGNGLILYLKISNLNEIWKNVQKLDIEIEEEIHLNTNSGKHQFCLRDLDGYYLIISE